VGSLGEVNNVCESCLLLYCSHLSSVFLWVFVMDCCRYVAPEYCSTGLLNERSDVYSFGVLLTEVITGRDPVDYSRATGEVPILNTPTKTLACRQWTGMW
jgi:hypothetical protein